MSPRSTKIVPILIGSVGAGLGLLLLGLGDVRNGQIDTDRSGASSVSTDNPSASSNSYPESHVNSSGTLPSGLHNFRLGMSVADAVAADPGLRDENNEPPSVSNRRAQPYTHTADGCFDMLSFSEGRLVLIISDLNNVSPDDSAAFNHNTVDHLGRPKVVINAGSSTDEWVWIDGDIRISYRNAADGIGSRKLSIQIADYPLLLRDIAQQSEENFKLESKSETLRLLKHDFGDETANSVIRALPTGFDDIKLKMTRSQLLSSVPEIQIKDYTERESRATVKTDKIDTDVFFWDDQIESLCRKWYDLPTDQAPKLHSRIMKELGNPTSWLAAINMESIDWDDGITRITYMEGASFAGSGFGKVGRTGVEECFSNVELSSAHEKDQLSRHPPSFKSVPVSKSFL